MSYQMFLKDEGEHKKRQTVLFGLFENETSKKKYFGSNKSDLLF